MDQLFRDLRRFKFSTQISQLFLIYYSLQDPASFFSIETDLIKISYLRYGGGIRDDMKEILMLPDATCAIKEGKRIKEG